MLRNLKYKTISNSEVSQSGIFWGGKDKNLRLLEVLDYLQHQDTNFIF